MGMLKEVCKTVASHRWIQTRGCWINIVCRVAFGKQVRFVTSLRIRTVRKDFLTGQYYDTVSRMTLDLYSRYQYGKTISSELRTLPLLF